MAQTNMKISRYFKNQSRRLLLTHRVKRCLSRKLTSQLDIRPPLEVVRKGAKCQVYFADTGSGRYVIKFYHPRNLRNARNSVVAQEQFILAGVDVPRLHTHDASKDTIRRLGLAYTVHEHIAGHGSSRSGLPEFLPRLAGYLARLHSRRSPDIGYLARTANWKTWGDFFGRLIRIRLAPFHQQEWGAGKDMINSVGEWFHSWNDRPGSLIDGHSLLHGDFNQHNIILAPDGRIFMIDLDLCQWGLNGIELTRALVRFCCSWNDLDSVDSLGVFWERTESRCEIFLKSYFNQLPDFFRDDWTSCRDFYLAWIFLERASSFAKDSLRPDRFTRPIRAQSRLQARSMLTTLSNSTGHLQK